MAILRGRHFRRGLQVAALAGALLTLGAKAEPKPGGPLFDADINLSDGAGVVTAFKLRGLTLSATLPIAEDGAAAGVYRLALDDRDALLDALAKLPDKVSGPPLAVGMPAAMFTLRTQGKTRTLVTARPTADERVSKALAELGRCEQAALAHPAAALALTVEAPKNGKPGQPVTVTVRANPAGEKGAEIQFDASALSLEAAAEPAPPTQGITPLPVEWNKVSQPPANPSPKILRAGTSLPIPLVAVFSTGEDFVRAILNGNVTFRLSDGHQEVRMHLSSKAVRIGVAKR